MIDLTGSYIIGGLLMLALLGLMISLSSKNQDSKLAEITLSSSDDIYQIMEYDFEKIGYRVESGSKISLINDSTITFRSDYDNNGVVDSITYSRIIDYTGMYSKNKKQMYLKKLLNPGAKSWTFPVKSFTFYGVDTSGNVTYNISAIKGVKIQMELKSESSDTLSSIGAFWRREFYPKNL